MQNTSSVATQSQRWLLCLALVFAVLWLGTLGARKLLDPDEGRYAEIPREMLATGDWLTPRLNDLKYFEKPPLQYWATAVAFATLGPSEIAARLWCGLTGLAGVVFVGWLGMRLFGREAGIMAAALLSGSLMYFVLGQVDTLDMGLTFFLTLAIGSFLLAQHAPLGSKSERNFMLLAWGSAALALLSKGIIAMALPAITLIVYSVVQRDYSAWRRLHLVLGLALFLIVGAPWFVAVSIVNPEFAKFFFLHEHFQRFLTDEAQRVEAWWFFIPLLIAGALPWTSIATIATVNAWRVDTAQFHARRFLIIWVAVAMIFFSISQSKLAPYILPVFPALALLTGDYLARSTTQSLRYHFAGIAVLWCAALGYFLFADTLGGLPSKRGIPPELFAQLFRWAAVAPGIALAGAGVAWMFAAHNRVRDAVLSMSCGTFLALALLVMQFDMARAVRSEYDLAQTIKPYLTPNQRIYSVATFDHSLTFYLGRTLTLVNYRGELDFGQTQEPSKSLTDIAAFKRAWIANASSIAIMKHEVFDALTRDGLPMTVIGRDLQLIAVKKP